MDRAALTRALTYIQAHLDGDVSLAAVAAIANCSTAYFAREFGRLMAETPKHYALRLRLEQAALRLILLDDSILQIALDYGFTSHETFTRAFRRHFGVAPRRFRTDLRMPSEAPHALPHRVVAPAPESLSRTVVKILQPMSLAFIRHTGPYEKVPTDLWDTLVEWAKQRRVPKPYVLLGIALDAPGITKPAALRFDAAIRVPAEFPSESRIGHQRFAGGLFAFTTSVGPLTSLPSAYHEIFARLCSDSKLECLGTPCLEFYRVNRIAADVDLAIVHTEIGVPVRWRR